MVKRRRTGKACVLTAAAGISILLGAAACQKTALPEETVPKLSGDIHDAAVETQSETLPELQPPTLQLSDTLSATMNAFDLVPHAYDWHYVKGGELAAVSTDAPHPLDMAEKEAGQTLTLKKYQKIDFTPFMVSAKERPDILTVREWDESFLGKPEAEPDAVVIYKESFILELQKGRIYELIAGWDREQEQERGYYGTVSYVVRTK